MKLLRVVIVVAIGLWAAMPVHAQTIDAALRARLEAAHDVSIVDDEGRRIDGHIVDVSDQTIRVSVRRAIEQIPIDRVVRIEKPDSLKNGAYAGLFVGTTFGLVTALCASGGGYDRRFAIANTVGNAIVFTAFGVGIDAMVNTRRTLYQRSGRVETRLAPLSGSGFRGAAIAVTW
jgi:hypothetical protein